MDLQQMADVIMMKVVYGGREGHVITSEDRDDAEYALCLDAAQAILDGRGDRLSWKAHDQLIPD